MISRKPALQVAVRRDAPLLAASSRCRVIDCKLQDHTAGIRRVNGTTVAVFEHVEVRVFEVGPLEPHFHECLRFGINVYGDVMEGDGGMAGPNSA
jgi:hypothetical protein